MSEDAKGIEEAQDNTEASEGGEQKHDDDVMGVKGDGEDGGEKDSKDAANEKHDDDVMGVKDDKDGDGDGKDGDDKDVKYEDFKFPEGTDVNADLLKTFTELGTKHKIPQEAAQELIDLFVGNNGAQADAAKQSYDEGWAAQLKDWDKTLASDKEFGGDKLSITHQKANRVIRQFDLDKEIRGGEGKLYSRCPGLNKLLARIADAVAEDSHESGDTGGDKPEKSDATVFYEQAKASE